MLSLQKSKLFQLSVVLIAVLWKILFDAKFEGLI